MHPLIDKQIDAIRTLCREYGVLRLDVFGSAATDAFDPDHSDIDFIVHYPDDYDFGPWVGRHFEFQERLEQILGGRVDLIMASAMRKPRFIQSVEMTRQILYAA